MLLKGMTPSNFKEAQQKAWEANRQLKEEKSHLWKGDQVSYIGIHAWVRRKLGKAKECSECGKSDGLIHWANISHEYKRDISDWKELCVSCHWKFDKPYLKRARDSKGKFI